MFYFIHYYVNMALDARKYFSVPLFQEKAHLNWFFIPASINQQKNDSQ